MPYRVIFVFPDFGDHIQNGFDFCGNVDIGHQFLPRGLFRMLCCSSFRLSFVECCLNLRRVAQHNLMRLLHSSSNHGLLYFDDVGFDFGRHYLAIVISVLLKFASLFV